MFAKDKVTQSMIDAVNSVINDKIEEGLADDFLKVAKSVNPNARAVTSADKKKELADKIARDKEFAAKNPPKHTPKEPEGLAKNHGYGQGRYMGDSVELEGNQIDEVSDKTLVNYLTKVDADSRKHKSDPTKRSQIGRAHV